MTHPEPSLFADVASALGIGSPAIAEKDYYAVQLLKALQSVNAEGYSFCFAGGTCLAKVYKNTHRMSEDIDIKMVPTGTPETETKSAKRKKRGEILEAIRASIESTDTFGVCSTDKRDEGRYQSYMVEYPRKQTMTDALRPNLLLEITESHVLEPVEQRAVFSLYAQVANLPPEIEAISCVTLASIAAEKFVALLRRTAEHERDNRRPDDPTLVRHVYDLHLIRDDLPSTESMKRLVQATIETDQARFGSTHARFVERPEEELKHGLHVLLANSVHSQRYRSFLGPLVYHDHPATWAEVTDTVQLLAHQWLGA